MNTSAPASTGSTAGHASATQTLGRASHLRGHGGGSADLFAQLLLLMGADAETNTGSPLATVATAADASGRPLGTQDPRPATDEHQNPLNQNPLNQPLLDLPGWNGVPLPVWSQAGSPARADANTRAPLGLEDGALVRPTAAERAAGPTGIAIAAAPAAALPAMAATPAAMPMFTSGLTTGQTPDPTGINASTASTASTASSASNAGALADAMAVASTPSAFTQAAVTAPGNSASPATESVAATGPTNRPTPALPERPTPADAATLNADARKALGLPGTGAEAMVSAPQTDNRPPAGAPPALGAQVIAWRSTTTLASGSRTAAAFTHHASAAAAQAAAHGAVADRSHAAGATAQHVAGVGLASTVASAGAAATGAREPANEPESTNGPSSTQDRPGTRLDSGAVTTDAGATASGTGGEASGGEAGTQDRRNPSDSTDTPNANRFDDGDDAGNPWSAQHLRHASVRVGETGESSIDIQLAMNGQELQVAFNTSDDEARAQLAQDAGAVLGDLLERSGIELGGVSVGGQGPQARQDNPGPAPQQPQPPRNGNGRQRPAVADAEPLRTATSATQPIRADGSRPLDLFA